MTLCSFSWQLTVALFFLTNYQCYQAPCKVRVISWAAANKLGKYLHRTQLKNKTKQHNENPEKQQWNIQSHPSLATD